MKNFLINIKLFQAKYIKIIFLLVFAFFLTYKGLYSEDKESGIPRFSHSFGDHPDTECTDCHARIPESTKEIDDNVPIKEQICVDCHDIEEVKPVVFYRSRPKNKLNFNHQAHVDQDIQCLTCHDKKIKKEDFEPGTAFPPMKVCNECHDGEIAPKKCGLCHAESVTFPHITHKNEAECVDCHTKAPDSTQSIDDNLPVKEEVCFECHDSEGDAPSIVEFKRSKPKNGLEFNHQVHVEQGLECKFCHKKIHDEDFEPGGAFPEMKLCYECHDNDTAPKKCSLCHKEKVQFPHFTHKNEADCMDCHSTITETKTTKFGPDIPTPDLCPDCHENAEDVLEVVKLDYYKRSVEFNHQQHVGKQLMSCDSCHAVAYEKNMFENKEITPEMEYCFQCHDNKTANQFCTKCHLEPLKPENHYQGWMKQHKLKANNDRENCLSCHPTEKMCLDCHNGTVKPRFEHNPNWELTHKFEARVAQKKCSACHTDRFCYECHVQKGVNLDSDLRIKRVHSDGWMNPNGPNFHAKRAKFRLSACKACHMVSDCNVCHFQGKNYK
ncbi:MAG: cytochrome c3 family protein [Spirochaetia bacterium]|nr:cytochrome c3 family protein [Spirochaetia bacterium]